MMPDRELQTKAAEEIDQLRKVENLAYKMIHDIESIIALRNKQFTVLKKQECKLEERGVPYIDDLDAAEFININVKALKTLVYANLACIGEGIHTILD